MTRAFVRVVEMACVVFAVLCVMQQIADVTHWMPLPQPPEVQE